MLNVIPGGSGADAGGHAPRGTNVVLVALQATFVCEATGTLAVMNWKYWPFVISD